MDNAVIRIEGLAKTYAGGTRALDGVDLDVREGEILALLGPNGAGKTTLIQIVCGIVTASAGDVFVGGHHWRRDYRRARALIGLVPQELHTDAFEPVIDTVNFSRMLFGRARNDAFIERLLRDLTLWDKRDAKIMELSGGMKRRVMIAKALAHEPRILFLDEPTAGVDVELRRDMWAMVRGLRARGVTIILTTHYIEEAEEMADRVGVIGKGRLIVVEEKERLMRTLGRKRMTLRLAEPAAALPAVLAQRGLELGDAGHTLTYEYSTQAADSGAEDLLDLIRGAGLRFVDIDTHVSSLEEIFVRLVHGDAAAAGQGAA